MVVCEILKSAHAGARFTIYAYTVDSEVQVAQSIAPVKQPVTNFELFSGFDGVLVLLQEKQKVVLVWMDFKFSQPL